MKKVKRMISVLLVLVMLAAGVPSVFGAGMKNEKTRMSNEKSVQTNAPFWGEITNDGIVSIADVVMLADFVNHQVSLTPEQICFGDVNLDGVITSSDGTTPNERGDVQLLADFTVDSSALPAEELAQYEFVAPTKTKYGLGESLDASGMSVIVSNKNNADVSYTLTDNIEVIGYDANVEGEQELTATFRGLSFAFTVTVAVRDTYNLGDETYSFKNYVDTDSPNGHCFGMSSTSSMYYQKLLSLTDIGATDTQTLYSLDLTEKVQAPICHYQAIQGSYSNRAIVAGGSSYLGRGYDIASDWAEVVSYVENHGFDGMGSLQIGFRKNKRGGHAINFLRYEVVDGQKRIYAYDNNFPTIETYFYQDSNGSVWQAPRSTFDGSIDCIALRDVLTYYNIAEHFDATHVIYAPENSISIVGAKVYPMECDADGEYYMYEIPSSYTQIEIIPQKENAVFTYMEQTNRFGKIDQDTYGVFTLADADTFSDTAVFEIHNAPGDFHTHTYTATVTTPATCTEPGKMTYTCVDGDDIYTETIPATGHADDNNDGHCDACGEQMTGGDHCKFCGKIHNGGFFDKLTGFFHKFFAIFKR